MLTRSPLYVRKAQDDSGDETERIGLIAEILSAVFGDKAEAYLDGETKSFFSLSSIRKAWQAIDHPRGKNGRFIEKNSGEAFSTAKEKIASTLKGAKTPATHKELLEHLNILSVKQLHQLKREYKLSASGENKERLAAKIAERLGKGRTEVPEVDGPSYKEWAKGERESRKTKPEVKNEQAAGASGQQRPELERTDRGEPAGDAGTVTPRQNRIITDREQHTGNADLERVPGHLREHLNDAQKFGVAKAIESLDKHGGFLLADGTGVGKTRQLLSVADKYARDGKKVVIVAPAEVIKPDWKKGTFGGSYSHDGETLGVSAKLAKGDAGLKGGAIALTTYNELGKLKDQIDKDTIVIFDESHAMKNANSQRGKHGRDIGFNAGAVMYATATPADKPLHIAHLLRAGVFGGGDTNAKKFFGKAADTYQKLGLRQETFYNRHAGREITKWSIDPKVGHMEVARRISGLFDQMTKDGLMVQRSLSMDNVDSSIDHVQLPPEAHAAAKKAFDDSMEKDGNKAVALMAMRRAQEPHKIDATVEHVQREIAAGRQPIIFLGRVNDNVDDESDDDDTGAVDENTAKLLKNALVKAGIDEKHIGELHGAAASTADAKRKAMQHFQSGKTPVLISTIQSGGTGVNLDDTVGNKPRSIVMMTPPLSGNDMLQAAGRINRLSTKSNAKIISLVSDDPIDHWNMALLGKKMKTLGAVLGKGFESFTGGDEEQAKEPYEWGTSLVRKPIPTPLAASPVPSAANVTSPGEPTRKVNTRNGERHVISWSPSKKFWDLRRAGKLPSSVGVGKNPRTGDWEATIWGESPEHANKVHGELKRMGAKSLSSPFAKSLAALRASFDAITSPLYLRKSEKWDESKHPRADDGKFGSGGSDKHPRDHGKFTAAPGHADAARHIVESHPAPPPYDHASDPPGTANPNMRANNPTIAAAYERQQAHAKKYAMATVAKIVHDATVAKPLPQPAIADDPRANASRLVKFAAVAEETATQLTQLTMWQDKVPEVAKSHSDGEAVIAAAIAKLEARKEEATSAVNSYIDAIVRSEPKAQQPIKLNLGKIAGDLQIDKLTPYIDVDVAKRSPAIRKVVAWLRDMAVTKQKAAKTPFAKSLAALRASSITVDAITKSLEDHEIPDQGIDTQPFLDELAEILGGLYGDKALSMIGGGEKKSLFASPLFVTKATKRNEGETWQTGKFWFRREGGRTFRVANPHGGGGGGSVKNGQPDVSAPTGQKQKQPAPGESPLRTYAPDGKKPNPRAAKQQAAIKGAASTIARIKAGDRSPEAHKELMGHLGGMTIPQLKQLRAEHGIKAPSPRLKAQIVEKLAKHLHGGGPVETVTPAKTEAAAKPAKPAIPSSLAKKSPKASTMTTDQATAKLKKLYDAAKDDSGIFEKVEAFKPELAKLSQSDLKKAAETLGIGRTVGSKKDLIDRIGREITERQVFHAKTKINPDEDLGR